MFPFGETVQREAYIPDGAEDSHGNPVDSWASSVDIPNCAFVPGGSVERVEPGRNAVVTQPQILAPAGTVAESRDRFTVRGKQYEVDGDPAEYRSPFTGWEPGVVINLKRTEG